MKRLLLRLFSLISSIFKSHLIVYFEAKLKLMVGRFQKIKEEKKNEENNTNNY